MPRNDISEFHIRRKTFAEIAVLIKWVIGNESACWAIRTILPGIWSYPVALPGLILRSIKAMQFSSTSLKQRVSSLLLYICRIFMTLGWELYLSTASLVEIMPSSNPISVARVQLEPRWMIIKPFKHGRNPVRSHTSFNECCSIDKAILKTVFM